MFSALFLYSIFKYHTIFVKTLLSPTLFSRVYKEE